MHLKVSLYFSDSINVSNVITVAIFELIMYVAFNLSWISNNYVDLGRMITT